MGATSDGNDGDGPSNRAFLTTRWSVILSAGGGDSPDARAAMEMLCRTYRAPIYRFACKSGYPKEVAEDLTQGFFARFLEKNDVRDANRERGKFRNFLLTSFKHFAANERKRMQALKRGGRVELLNLDTALAEAKYAAGFAESRTPEQEYERQWALTLIDETISSLAQEYAAAGKAAYFEQLQMHLPGAYPPRSHKETAEALSTSTASIKTAVFRLRRRFDKLFRSRIADTLENPDDVDDEIRYLLRVLSE